MKRQIVVAIVAVSAVAVILFGIPLGFEIHEQFDSQALLRIERNAIVASRQLPVGWRPGDGFEIEPPDADTTVSLYDTRGRRTAGTGPDPGDETVMAALSDQVADRESNGSYVISVPITESGTVVGALRAEQRLEVTSQRFREALAWMGLLAFFVIGVSVVVALRLARRLTSPIEVLRASAGRLGAEPAALTFTRSGLPEVDDVADALEGAAARVADSVERERAFSAALSHQLRTPITGLRLLIDTEMIAPRPDRNAILTDAASAVDRLEATVDELLLLSRNRPTDRGALDLAALAQGAAARWRRAFAAGGRSLVTADEGCGTVVASHSAVEHIIDVLIDNALRHGRGEVSIACEPIEGGVALRVGDRGAVDPQVIDAVLGDRSDGAPLPRARIGLGLARRLAQAEGGELVCTSTDPTTFSLLFPTV